MHSTEAGSTGAESLGERVTTPNSQDGGQDVRRTELARLLTERGVPGKDDIMRVKHLVRDLMPQDKAGDERRKSFFSAYFDIYLGRITGERSLERDGLRRCLKQLAIAEDRSAQP